MLQTILHCQHCHSEDAAVRIITSVSSNPHSCTTHDEKEVKKGSSPVAGSCEAGDESLSVHRRQQVSCWVTNGFHERPEMVQGYWEQ